MSVLGRILVVTLLVGLFAGCTSFLPYRLGAILQCDLDEEPFTLRIIEVREYTYVVEGDIDGYWIVVEKEKATVERFCKPSF